MRKVKGFLLIGIIMSILFSSIMVIAAEEMTAEEIINKRDNNEYFDSVKIEAEMIIVNGGRKITKTMIALSDKKDSLVEFTNSQDRGNKIS